MTDLKDHPDWYIKNRAKACAGEIAYHEQKLREWKAEHKAVLDESKRRRAK